jgi:hypothetical protein
MALGAFADMPAIVVGTARARMVFCTAFVFQKGLNNVIL